MLLKPLGRIILFALVLSIFTSLNIEAQTPYTNTGNAKYVKTTVDTFSIPGVTGAYRKGFITNQSTTLSLNVMFSTRAGVKDTSSRVVIPAGKTLHFNFVGTKIFRYAVTGTDSVYSQVIIGDVQLNYLEPKDGINLTYNNQLIDKRHKYEYAILNERKQLFIRYSYKV
jgi:hypothetical protein